MKQGVSDINAQLALLVKTLPYVNSDNKTNTSATSANVEEDRLKAVEKYLKMNNKD